MSFDLEELFVDVFAPQYGDVALIMIDLPHDDAEDTPAWQARRDMARDWHEKLQGFASSYGVGVLPLVTYLSADYAKIARICSQLAPFFEKGIALEVSFSTGHKCTFDISDKDEALKDDGRLHPGVTAGALSVRNLPSGEVAITPREDAQSRTAGEIPVSVDDEIAIFAVQRNRIVDVRGESQEAKDLRASFREDPARANIAEVAIGCNDNDVLPRNSTLPHLCGRSHEHRPGISLPPGTRL